MDRLNLLGFNSISLKDLDKVRLLNRKDTKFVFSKANLLLFLDKLKPFYQILEINGLRTFAYENTYFDTDEFLFYIQHHNESRKRFKVRHRKYCETNEQYFEIKIKDKSYKNFNKRINRVKTLLQMFLNLNSKKKIVGYGASTKGNVVLNHCKIKNTQIKEICDGSVKKISK